jgi:hypothetical protein
MNGRFTIEATETVRGGCISSSTAAEDASLTSHIFPVDQTLQALVTNLPLKLQRKGVLNRLAGSNETQFSLVPSPHALSYIRRIRAVVTDDHTRLTK